MGPVLDNDLQTGRSPPPIKKIEEKKCQHKKMFTKLKKKCCFLKKSSETYAQKIFLNSEKKS